MAVQSALLYDRRSNYITDGILASDFKGVIRNMGMLLSGNVGTNNAIIKVMSN